MKDKFTLAETIILFIAFCIIASFIVLIFADRIKKKGFYEGFINTYNMMVKAFNASINENGEPDAWVIDIYKQDEAREKYVYPYVKYTTVCDSSDENSCLSYSVSPIALGSKPMSLKDMGLDKAVILKNGSLLYVEFHNGSMDVFFDTNGSDGPNIIGRDFFVMEYRNVDGKWQFYLLGDFISADCNISGFGQGCAARLLKDGAMNY